MSYKMRELSQHRRAFDKGLNISAYFEIQEILAVYAFLVTKGVISSTVCFINRRNVCWRNTNRVKSYSRFLSQLSIEHFKVIYNRINIIFLLNVLPDFTFCLTIKQAQFCGIY
jgi:hypothetical protein